MNKKLLKMRRLAQLVMAPYRAQFVLAILLTMVSTTIMSLFPFIIGLVITELTYNVRDMAAGVAGAGINTTYIAGVVMLKASLVVVGFFAEYASVFVLTGAVQNSMRDLRRKINGKMNTLPVSYFDGHPHGKVLNVITSDVDVVSGALQQTMLTVVNAAVTLTATFTMMMVISPKLGAISLVLLPAVFFASRFLFKKSQQEFRQTQETLADMSGFIQEQYGGFDVLRLFNQEKESVKKFEIINSRLNRSAFRGIFISSLLRPVLELIVDLLYIAMVIFTGLAVMFSGMPLGSMQAFVQYIWQVYGPLGQVSMMSGAVQSALASMERIVNFMDEEEERVEGAGIDPVVLENLKGNITFDHLHFAYDEVTPLINDLSFCAKAGQTVAIVGPTGAGKTTLINLLMRFYTADRGKITIDGIDIQEMTRSQVRSLFGMVLQDAWLYHATIAENIRFGRLSATEYEVVDAAKLANVDHFIKTMPGGYEMMISREADNISLGQKQLLTIARVILANPKFLILDEATSSVDTRLEMLIQKAMKTVMKGRTSFVIAHRLSTIRDADLILVMQDGDIVEQGTHDVLLGQGGLYEKLYNSQFAEE